MRRSAALTLPLALALLFARAPAALAQDRPLEDHDLPRRVEARLRALLDDSATVRFDGPTRIDARRTIDGDVTAFGGPFTLAGRVDGDLVIIDGDLVFEPGGAVAGDVTVVGGRVRGVDSARIAGSLTVYGEGFAAAGAEERRRRDEADRRRDDPWWDDDRWNDDRWDDDDLYDRDGFARLTVRGGVAYNRVEGLPLAVGPVVQTGGSNPTRLLALGILRTEDAGELDRRDIGYELRAEQFLGGERSFRVGVGAHSVIEPIDGWTLRDIEAGLSTALLHEDPRDHYDRTGWSAYARFAPRDASFDSTLDARFDATLEFRDDEYTIVPAGDPFTLFGDDPWRRQPLIATGTLRSIGGRVVVDARNDDDFATRGWYLEASALRGIDGSLEVPAFSVLGPGLPGDGADPSIAGRRFEAVDVLHLFVDARRYERTGRDGLLGFRVVTGGTPLDRPLPPQFQHALGGAGSAPGFDRFALDCGARAVAVATSGDDAFHPFYGCDRFVLFQAEFLGRLDFGLDFDRDYDDDDWWDDLWDWSVDLDPAWAAFFDAARGWTLRDTGDPVDATDTGARYDVGAGVLLGGLGLYAALPLNGPDDDPRFTLRLGRRF